MSVDANADAPIAISVLASPIPPEAVDLLFLIADASGTPMDRETFDVAFERHYEPGLDTVLQAVPGASSPGTRRRRKERAPSFAGLLRYGPWPRPGQGDAVAVAEGVAPHIFDVVVDPAWRGHGVGRRLMEEVFRRLRKDGAPVVHSRTSVENTAAVALHRACGFTVMREEEGYYIWRLQL